VRRWFPRFALGALLASATWVVSRATLAPADFTFVNETEPESLDPAIAIGRPEHRLITALFEGLVTYDQRTLAPQPGVAERWELSDDRLQYTFHLRDSARWSDGRPVTAHDFAWSFRRLLDPLALARYSYQLWYVRNAKRYTTMAVEKGDPVEVELHERPAGAEPFARGVVLRGVLRDVAVDDPGRQGPKPGDSPPKVFTIEIDNRLRRFQVGDQIGRNDAAGGDAPAAAGQSAEPPIERCKLVTLDFDEVGIRATDQRTLVITLAQPTPFFLDLAAFFALSPVPRHCVERHGYPGWIKPQNFVGNGPYRLVSRRIRDRLRLAKNQEYWNRDRVSIATVDALSVDAPATALNLYLTGAADWITNAPPIVVGDLRSRPDFHSAPELTVNFYRFNLREPPLDNRLVRRALALAIDRREIVERIMRAGEQPALSLVPPGIHGYPPAQGPGHDVEAARRSLAEAGYPGGEGLPPIKILYNQDDTHESVAQLIQDQWKRSLGVNANLQTLEWGSYLAAQHQMQYQACRAGWVGDYPDPNTFLDLFVSGGANNMTGFADPQYDRLIAAAAAEADPARRFEILRQAETLLLDETPIVPLYFRVSKNMVSPRVQGFFPNLLDIHPVQDLSLATETSR